MGTTIYTCDFCQEKQTENSPILEIHSLGKYQGKFICFDCLKKKIKIILIYEQRLQEKT